MKLAAIVVTYNPDMLDVVHNIMSYAEEVDYLIVWDNTTTHNNDWSELRHLGGNVLISQNGENIGLASAYNIGIKLSRELNCTHIMTMDQDSCFEEFHILKDFLCNPSYIITSIICPPINTPNTPLGINSQVRHAAQSGCIFPLDLFDNVGGFREDFFIGMVDVEMQLKAVEHGYTIVQVGGCNLIHHIGSGRIVHKFGKTFGVSDYGPLRYYYDSRNRILMWKEFPYDYSFKGKLHFICGRIKLCFKIILAEDNKLVKVGAIFRGTINGALNRVLPY